MQLTSFFWLLTTTFFLVIFVSYLIGNALLSLVQAIEYLVMVYSHQVYHGGQELVFGLNLGFQLTVTLIRSM